MWRHASDARPFSLDIEHFDPLPRLLLRLARPVLEQTFGLEGLNRLYADATFPGSSLRFADKVLETLGVSFRISPTERSVIPTHGSVVVVANHPFGGLDGLILMSLLQAVRPDVKLVGNSLLRLVPELTPWFFFVDPFGGTEASRRNVSALKAAARWVSDGGALALFPAGEVSHLQFGARGVADPDWNTTVGRLVHLTRAPVLTVHFCGRNSGLFQMLGLVHPRIRTAMLPRELLNKRRRRVTVHIGSLIPYQKLARFGSAGDLTEYLRSRTYLLSVRSSPVNAGRGSAPFMKRLRLVQPIAEPLASAALADEIDRLPPDRLLASSNNLATYCAHGHEMVGLLAEIGRLREAAFRGVGEGTGRDRDLDRFDSHYLHLFVWNRARQEIVGGYRMGQVDEILARFGPAGLYATTLFRFKPRLLDQLANALELGRSFVRVEYQRDYAPLMLLWKAIGRFVVANPRYRMLFGPVSISNEYQSLSKYLMMMFLQANRSWPALGGLIEPRRSPRLPFFRDWDPSRTGRIVRDLDEVDELLREIETDQRSVPTLLRQYLKLNARLLAFSRDPNFSDVVDGLMLVDLTKVDRAILVRYMGREGADGYLAQQAQAEASVSPTHRAPTACESAR